MKLFSHIYILFIGKHCNENKIIEYAIGFFSSSSFITKMQERADRSNHWVVIQFYYSQIMKTFGPNIYSFLIQFDTLENIHPTTFRNYTKHPIKMLFKKQHVLLRKCNPASFL